MSTSLNWDNNAIAPKSADWTQPGYNPAEHNWWKADTGEANNGYPKDYFFADTMRAISIAFGQKFGNIFVTREDEKGYVRKRIQVPIKFGPRSKAHDFRTELESGTIDENGIVEPIYKIQNPNMTWKFTQVSYDGSRQTSSDQIRTFYDKYLLSKGVELSMCDLLWQDTMPIPFNIGIQLTAYTDKDSDAQRILEQVLTKTKDSVLFLYVKEFWFMNIRRDIKVKLESCEFTPESDDMGEDAKREIKVTFNFVCEAVLYRPIEKSYIITSIISTLDAHTNGADIVRVGLSGNMYIDEKYSNSAAYASAVANQCFDGSKISGYDFTNRGRNSFGLVSAVTATHSAALELTTEQIEELKTKYSADNIQGYRMVHEYGEVPDSWREYDRTFKLLTSTDYIFGDTVGSAINGYEIEEIINSGAYLATINNYEYPYTGFEKNGYVYNNKYFTDSKQNAINTIYATSHESSSYCEYCKSYYRAGNVYQYHLSHCSANPGTEMCQYCSGYYLQGHMLESHIEKCPKNPANSEG